MGYNFHHDTDTCVSMLSLYANSLGYTNCIIEIYILLREQEHEQKLTKAYIFAQMYMHALKDIIKVPID